jgi:hypothetical protein
MEQQLPLKDIHLPEAVSWWPPALGWWLLALISVLLLATLIIWSIRTIKQGRYRRAALAELQQYTARLEANGDVREYADRVNRLLRRVAIHSYGRTVVSHLTGKQWQDFLHTQCPHKGFDPDKAHQLLMAAYSKEPQLSLVDSSQLARLWIKKHSRAIKPSGGAYD